MILSSFILLMPSSLELEINAEVEIYTFLIFYDQIRENHVNMSRGMKKEEKLEEGQVLIMEKWKWKNVTYIGVRKEKYRERLWTIKRMKEQKKIEEKTSEYVESVRYRCMGEIENNTWSHTRINFICGKAKI